MVARHARQAGEGPIHGQSQRRRQGVFQLLDPEFVYGAPGDEIPDALTEQLEGVDARERESGCAHLMAMFRELKSRHDEFLRDVQDHVRRDVELHDIFEAMAISE